ncbi:hypothetical protein SLEP1_g5506 [Rubroshorea leprosula]|uniref:TTF-type domain-containing protein n=1 Tax=Rubroshorea leprosula TaxID=152421 RepID=A0AAV5I096_9ROSI|nr:hypothetical protein SLEP1_g5506 [Rubroshorea leprosula]
MSKKVTIDSFFKRKERNSDDCGTQSILVTLISNLESVPNIENFVQLQPNTVPNLEQPPSKVLKIGQNIDIASLERDPGIRPKISNYPINQQDEIQYSPAKDAVFCFPCYLFAKKPSGKQGGVETFTSIGFKKWKQVNNGDKCKFLAHMGKDPNSIHNIAVKCLEDFKNQSCHVEKVLDKQSSQQIEKNRLRLKTSIDVVRWLTFQVCAFRGHDESLDSKNRARDESKRKQMSIVVRFVDKDGFVKERLLDVVHVRETNALTLKQEICSVLSHHNLSIQNVRGQGYDGASNMRGEWNGLQALILQECPYAYYVHCLAHQLQLALIAVAREAPNVHAFFQNLTSIINIASSSCKRHDELQATYALEIAHLVEINEIETGRGANQLGTLQRPTNTRWSSHFKSICSLLRIFTPTTSVLENVAVEGSTYSQRGDATFALNLVRYRSPRKQEVAGTSQSQWLLGPFGIKGNSTYAKFSFMDCLLQETLINIDIVVTLT